MQRNKNYKSLQTRKNGFLGIWVCHLRENSHAPSPQTSSSEILVLSKEAYLWDYKLLVLEYFQRWYFVAFKWRCSSSAGAAIWAAYRDFMTSYDTKWRIQTKEIDDCLSILSQKCYFQLVIFFFHFVFARVKDISSNRLFYTSFLTVSYSGSL